MTFSAEQLNFFKFSTVVVDYFPVALRQVFVYMWDTSVASPRIPKWDDSVTVLNLFLVKEGGAKKVPTLNKSYKEWDCTSLFKATLFARTFAMPDGTGGVSTLDKLFVKPRCLSSGTFHHSVVSPTGNQAETYALALDQLRLLRNTLCHQISTLKIDKTTFDNYIQLVKDAFTALGQNTTKIDEIGKLGEDDFPTTRLKQLKDELKKEKDAAIKFKQIDDRLTKIGSQVVDLGSDVKDVKTDVTDVKSQVEDVGSDVKDVKTDVTNVKTQVEDVGSDVKDVKAELTDVKSQVEDVGSDVKAELTDVKSQVEDVGSDVKDVKTDVTNVKTQVEDVGSDVKDVKAELTDVKSQVEDVGSDVKDVKTDVTNVKTQVEDVGSDVKDVKAELTDVKSQVEDVGSDVKAELTDVKSQVEDVGSDVKDVKTDVTNVKTQVEDVGSDVKDVKAELTDVKSQVEDVGSDVKDVKTDVTNVKTQVEDVGSDVKDVKAELTDVKSQVEDVGSDVKDVKTDVTNVKSQVEDVGSDVKDVKTDVTNVKTQVEDVGSDVKDVKAELTDVKSQVEDVGSDVKDVKTDVTNVKTQVEDVGSDVKDVKAELTDVKSQVEDVGSDVKAELTDVKSQVEDVGSDVKDVKTDVTNVKTQVEDVGSDVKDVKAELTDVKSQVEDVGSDVKDVKTDVTNVKTQVEDVGSDVKDVKAELTDVKSQVEDVGSDVKDVKTDVTNVKTQVEDVGSDVKDVKAELTDVKSQVEDVGSDVKDVKTDVTNVKTQVEDVGSDVKDVKAELTDVKSQVEDVGSDVKAELTDMKTKMQQVCSEVKGLSGCVDAMQAGSSEGLLVPVSCIPDKIPYFVGRQKECEAVLDHLTNKATRLVDIWGPPGFGKTSLAINVAHHLREMKIPVYLTSLRGMKSKDEIVSKLLSIFTDAKQAFYVSPSHWLIQCLQQLGKTCILILDNADDILESGDTELKEDFLRFTEEVLAHCSHIKLLFTTRERLDYLRQKLPIRQERVGVLDKVSSVSLVQSLLQCVSDNDCDCIVKECGQVPLAMRLMCGIMKEENVSLSELLEELKASTLVEVLDDESLPDDARLETIINRSFGRLSGQERDAFVSLTVFTSFFGVQEATAVLDFKAARQTKKVLRSLQRKSLLDCSDDFESCTIHSLLRSFVDETRNSNNAVQIVFNAAQRRFYDYYISSFEVANEEFLTGHSSEAFQVFFRQRDSILISLENGAKNDTLYPQVVKVLSKAEIFLRALLPNGALLFNKLYSTTIEEAKKRKYRDDECNLLAAKSFGTLGGFYVERQNSDLSLQAGFPHTESCPAKHLCYLGVHQLLRGKTDDGISYLKASVDRLNSDCDEKVLKVLAYHVLAVYYRKKGDVEKASQFEFFCSRECKSASFSPTVRNLFLRDVCSGEVTDFGSIMEQDVFFFVAVAELLPLLYSELQFGKHTEKEQSILTQHLVGLHKVLLALFSKGIVRVRVLEACCNALYSLKCFKEAAEGFRIIINELEKIQGSELNRTAQNYFFRSSALKEMKDYKGADFCLKKSLDIRRQLLQEILDLKQSKKIVGELHSLISCLEMQKTLNGATAGPTVDFKTLFEELKSALKSMENNNNADHAEIARCYNQLGHCYFLLHDWNAAHELFEQALKIDEKHMGDSDGKVSYLVNKGTACFNMNRNIEAGEAFQRALNLTTLLGIEDHADTAIIYQRLGENHLALEEFSEALKAGRQSLQLRKKHLGDHILTAQSFSLTGAVYFQMGKYEAAREHAQHTANITKALLGDHEETATAFDQLATVSLEIGDYRGALNACQEVRNIRLKLLGEHPDTAISFHQFGRVCVKMDNFKEAARSFRKASEMRLILLGDHLDTALSYHCLGEAQLLNGDFSGALESLHTALRIREEELGIHSETAATSELLGRAYEGLSLHDLASQQIGRTLEMREYLQTDGVNTALGDASNPFLEFNSEGEYLSVTYANVPRV